MCGNSNIYRVVSLISVSLSLCVCECESILSQVGSHSKNSQNKSQAAGDILALCLESFISMSDGHEIIWQCLAVAEQHFCKHLRINSHKDLES